jgi:hypothetical protein
MKYVLGDGAGTSILYDDYFGIRPYSGILEYLRDDELIFTSSNIPTLTIQGVKGRHFELWKSGRWYLVTVYETLRDSDTIEILTNPDNNQGSVIGIFALTSSSPFYTSTSQVEFYYRYLVDIGVYRDAKLYSAGLYFDEKFALAHTAFGDSKRLEQDAINLWLPRIQTEILPDFVETYLEK